MGFDLGKLLEDVSMLDTNREQIEYIPREKICSDPNNFYLLSGIEELAANIALCGLQQPVRLRKHPSEDGLYMIVSGHRRMAAMELLYQDDPERWEEVPCIVEADNVASPALQQLRLIYANANTRTLTSAEQGEQAEQVTKLLYQLKEEGYEFPGRMRDHVAEAVNVSKTKLARLKVIREKLAKCWLPSYRADVIKEATAYTLAQLPKEWQEILWGIHKEKPQYAYQNTVENQSRRMSYIAELQCTHGCACGCQNVTSMMIRNFRRIYVGVDLNLLEDSVTDLSGNYGESIKDILADVLQARSLQLWVSDSANGITTACVLLDDLYAENADGVDSTIITGLTGNPLNGTGAKFELRITEKAERVPTVILHYTANVGSSGGGSLPADFPVSVDENGYTQIEGLPRATNVDSVQDGNTVNMTITMQDGSVINGVLVLNDSGEPVSYTEDGITCTFTHTVVTKEGG